MKPSENKICICGHPVDLALGEPLRFSAPPGSFELDPDIAALEAQLAEAKRTHEEFKYEIFAAIEGGFGVICADPVATIRHRGIDMMRHHDEAIAENKQMRETLDKIGQLYAVWNKRSGPPSSSLPDVETLTKIGEIIDEAIKDQKIILEKK